MSGEPNRQLTTGYPGWQHNRGGGEDPCLNGGGVMRRRLVGGVVCAALVGLVAGASAQEKKSATAGVLKCNEASGWGMIYGSTRDLKCVFSPAEKGAKPERYTGVIKKYGVDIGYQQHVVLLWAVASSAPKLEPGALAGTYVGVTGEAAWAVGLGANVLVGGSKKGIALQPVSIEGLTGANVAAGVVEVELKLAK